MIFKEGQRVIAINNGYNYGKREDPMGLQFTHDYTIGWKGTANYNGTHWVISFDNGRVIKGCDRNSFELLKEETKMKPGDTVKVSGCTGSTSRFNGKTGKYLEAMYPNDSYKHTVSFDGKDNDGHGCGYLFADSELTVVPQLVVGSKVTVDDGSYSYELVDGKFIESYTGVEGKIYEITEMGCDLPSRSADQRNDTIIRRISDGRVFFVQQRFLKEYAPPKPKFKRGEFVEYSGEYFRVCRSSYEDNEYIYECTGWAKAYDEDRGYTVAKESELREVQH